MKNLAQMKLYCFSEDKPIPAASYLEFGSELKIKVDLAYPLNATREEKKDVEAIQVDEVHVWGFKFTHSIYYMYSYELCCFSGHLWNQDYKSKHLNSANDSKKRNEPIRSRTDKIVQPALIERH